MNLPIKEDIDRRRFDVVILPASADKPTDLTMERARALPDVVICHLTARELAESAAMYLDRLHLVAVADRPFLCPVVVKEAPEHPVYVGRIISVANITPPTYAKAYQDPPPKLTRDQIRGPRRRR